jgi:hypothetical protein
MELESAADIGGLEKIEFDIFSLTLEARCDFDRKELSAALEAVKMLDRLSGTLASCLSFVRDGIAFATDDFVRAELNAFLAGRPGGGKDCGKLLIDDVWGLVADIEATCMAVTLAFATMRASQEPHSPPRSNEFAAHIAFWEYRCTLMALGAERLSALPPADELRQMIETEIERFDQGNPFGNLPAEVIAMMNEGEQDDVRQGRRSLDEALAAALIRRRAERLAKEAHATVGKPAAAPAKAAKPTTPARSARQTTSTDKDEALLDAMRADQEGSLATWARAIGVSSKGSLSKRLGKLAENGLVENVAGRWRVKKAGQAREEEGARNRSPARETGVENGRVENARTENAPAAPSSTPQPIGAAPAPSRAPRVGSGRRVTLTLQEGVR